MLAAVPASVRAQATAASSEPVLERRTVPTAGSAAAAEPDPWLVSYIGLGGRTARMNLAQLDRALEPYGATYSRLAPEDRTLVRRAFDDIMPGQPFGRTPVNAPQSRAIVYLALGPWERRVPDRPCGGPRRRGGSSRCDQAIDSMSRHAAWIHSAALALGRASNRRPRPQELADLRAMNEHARDMVRGGGACGCPETRGDSDALLAATREAMDVYEGSVMPAWMSLGDQRVQRIARLSDSLERTFLRCLGEG
jgi:hypothetical protein